MKGIRLILAVCLAVTCVFGARADNDGDAVRAAARRGAPTTAASATQSRQKPTANSTTTNTQSTRDTANVANRAVTTGTTAPTTTQSRSATSPVSARENATTQSRTATGGSVVSRTGANVVAPRATTTTATRSATRTGANVQSRTTPTTRAATNTTRQSRAAVGAITRAASGAISAPHRTATNSAARQSRAATDTATTTTAVAGNYKECRTVYYECMDEFCANKDSQLRRCACSSRMSEFDGLKEQMTKVEDKLLDFNQRLLTVNMDKEDAIAINTATEGELAFNQADKSDSKKMLDEISKKLNDTFKNSKLDNNLSAINLSLDMDSAFDNLDSMMGASTVTKSGTELYSAALPICREMAAEVCSDDELSIAESGYQMMIEQDCNTVAKAYSSQAETAREKIREGGALLDMSRLNTYQTRNSDDILTCKSKMLEMLSDSAVCGTNLGKCLDTSGQYIDPSTGEAFLSEHLSQLATLLTRPTGDQKWTTVPGNEKFVTFLNNKKKFLAPAMENCQDIADTVWNEFIEDALAQIKLAQNAKLEDMRQSCTQLVAQCMTDTAKSISDFDARALSTFGVMADKTVREMCASVQTACTALLDNTGGDGKIWSDGVEQITTDKTYETLLYTCREVGKNCIIQACKSTSGNFGLCMNSMSTNRKSIVSRRACWDQVRKCVNDAGDETLKEIIESQKKAKKYDDTGRFFYDTLYDKGLTITRTSTSDPHAINTDIATVSDSDDNKYAYVSIYDICDNECSGTDSAKDSAKCISCRLAERIWGNCEYKADTQLTDPNSHNRILATTGSSKTDTLLSWFADNTNTLNAKTNLDSCLDAYCGAGKTMGNDGECYLSATVSSSGEVCDNPFKVDENGEITGCCKNGNYLRDKENQSVDNFDGAVCGYPNNQGAFYNISATTNGYYNGTPTLSSAINKNSNASATATFLPNGKVYIFAKFQINSADYYLVCVNDGTYTVTAPTNCGNGSGTGGELFIVNSDGIVLSPHTVGTPVGASRSRTSITNFYIKNKEGNECKALFQDKGIRWAPSSQQTGCDIPKRWTTKYVK